MKAQKVIACVSLTAVVVALLSIVAPQAMAAPAQTLRSNGDRSTVHVNGHGRVLVTVKATKCMGWPVARIWVDGRLDRVVTVKKSRYVKVTSKKMYRPGAHRVSVVMAKDKRVRSKKRTVCNRSVRVGAVKMQHRNPRPVAPVPVKPEPTTPPTTPTPEPTTPAPSPNPTTPAPAPGTFPTRANTGTPAGWTPTRTINGDHVVTTPGAVVQDIRIVGGRLDVRAPNVTIRRVEIQSGQIRNVFNRQCANGLIIEDTTIRRGTFDIGQPAIEFGGYTARRVKIDGPSEGFRVGGKEYGCGEVTIDRSFASIDAYAGCDRPDNGIDWHGDAVQGYNGAKVTVRDSTLLLNPTPYCLGNSAFFYPNQGNTSAVIDNVVMAGGGFVFRMETPGSVTGLKVVDDTWRYGPSHNTTCSAGLTWATDNDYGTYNAATGVWKRDRFLPCLGFRA
ncbi:hypothetical protein [Aeromicrobium sp. 179-A 4D2 NHS]|uniref:hypothetical protein n=1 Tax=Aeromicrobium sp. 179-A 4D2 NHS TaxID=3142375 RepID=UPI0039A29105